eukprot:1742325-Rhodomonas_salina.2
MMNTLEEKLQQHAVATWGVHKCEVSHAQNAHIYPLACRRQSFSEPDTERCAVALHAWATEGRTGG